MKLPIADSPNYHSLDWRRSSNRPDDAIISQSLDGVITSWNAGAERLFGYTAAETIGRSIAILLPPDPADEVSPVLEQIKQGKTIASYETTRVQKGGQTIDIAATISPIKDAAGQVIGTAKIARDITTRKRAKEQLRSLNDRLQYLLTNAPVSIFSCKTEW